MEFHTSVWYDGNEYVGSNGGQEIRMNILDEGVTPIQAVLMSAGACSLMDVRNILGKRRIEYDRLEVDVDGKISEDYPKSIEKIHMIYRTDAPLEEMERAVRLSHEKYCTVAQTLKPSVEITTEIIIY